VRRPSMKKFYWPQGSGVIRPILLAVLTFSAAIAGADERSSSPDLARLSTAIEHMLATSGTPGLSISIVSNDRVVFAKGFGVRRLGATDPVTEKTRFTIGSLSKAFTVALLGMLVDEGKLNWDDRVVDHLRRFQMYDAYGTRDIRIRDLLCHRTGVGTLAGDQLYVGSSPTWEEILEKVRYLEPSAPLRSKFQYNNLMYVVAGLVYQQVATESWSEAVKQRIFAPLGMRDSLPLLAELTTNHDIAVPHAVVGSQIRPVPYDSPDYIRLDPIGPAGGIISTAQDMAQWMRLWLSAGRYAGRVLLSQEVVRDMESLQIAWDPDPFDREELGNHVSGYGLGWRITDYRGHKLVFHAGGGIGINSFIGLMPELHLGVTVLTNFAPDYLQFAAGYTALDMFLGAADRDWPTVFRKRLMDDQADVARRAMGSAPRIKNTMPSHPISAYTGVYAEPASGAASVRVEAGHLVFDYNPRFRGDLAHWHYDTFEVTWRNPEYDTPPSTLLTFYADESGRVTGFAVKFYNDLLHFDRITRKRAARVVSSYRAAGRGGRSHPVEE
jgi:CubicO group peptidase (beta-lactamase class C family)